MPHPADVHAAALVELGLLPADRAAARAAACAAEDRDLIDALLADGALSPDQALRARAHLAQGASLPRTIHDRPASLDADTRVDPVVGARHDAETRVQPLHRGTTFAPYTDSDPLDPLKSGLDTTKADRKGSHGTVPLPQVGERIGGCEITGVLGVGGMGAVFRARDLQSRREVAIKILLEPDLANLYVRFQREGAIGRRLDHPGIVRMERAGEDERGRSYLVMELVKGAAPLNAFCQSNELGIPERLALVKQACSAIHAAHEESVIHRDVKPDNLLVTPAGQVKVVDFGLARDLDGTRLTDSNVRMGSMSYMAPEQVRGDSAKADRRTDVWALGIVLHELVTGERLFQQDSMAGLTAEILFGELPDLRVAAPHAPAGLAEVVARALERDPSRRHQTVLELEEDLNRVLTSRPPLAARPGPASEPAAVETAARGGPGFWAAAALCLAVALALAWTLRPTDESREFAALEQAVQRTWTSGVEADALRLRADLERLRAQGRDLPLPLERRIQAMAGVARLVRGDVAEAKRVLQSLGSDLRPPGLALRGGLAVVRGGDLEQAEADLTQAIEAKTGWACVYGWRARALTGQGPLERSRARLALYDLDEVSRKRALDAAEREAQARARAALERSGM